MILQSCAHLVKCCYNTLKEVGVPQDMDNTKQINQMLAMQELHPLAGPLPPPLMGLGLPGLYLWRSMLHVRHSNTGHC